MSKSKDKGTAFETAVVRYLRDRLGDDEIDRMPLRGSRDEGDIRGLKLRGMSVCVEVKNHKQLRLHEWMGQLIDEQGNMDADLGMIIAHRDGCGDKHIGESWCVTTLDDVIALALGGRDV